MPYKDLELRRLTQSEYRLTHVELYKNIDKKYKSLNPEKIKLHQKNWKQKNIEHLKQYRNEYRKNNLRKCKLWDKAKLEKHGEAINKKRRESYHNRKNTDPQYKIALTCRNRVASAINSIKSRKSAKTLELLGCTIEQLKIHLESRFYINKKTGEVMTWNNHSKFGWHIDHIKPVDSFDLQDPEEQRNCFNYTNHNLCGGMRI